MERNPCRNGPDYDFVCLADPNLMGFPPFFSGGGGWTHGIIFSKLNVNNSPIFLAFRRQTWVFSGFVVEGNSGKPAFVLHSCTPPRFRGGRDDRRYREKRNVVYQFGDDGFGFVYYAGICLFV